MKLETKIIEKMNKIKSEFFEKIIELPNFQENSQRKKGERENTNCQYQK